MDKSHNKEQIDDFIKRTHRGLILKNVNNHPINNSLGYFLNERKNYLSIYDECLSKKYSNPSLGPLNDLLYIIVNDLESNSHSSYFLFDEDEKIKIIRELIDLFTRIINDRKDDQIYNQVYSTYKLILNLSLEGLLSLINAGFYLKAFFYPIEVYAEKNYDFQFLMNSVIFKYVYDHHVIDLSKFNILDSRLIRILDMYREYYGSIPKYHNIQSQHTVFRNCMDIIVFRNCMDNVITQFYIGKYDISLFPNVLDYVVNNIEQLKDFCRLNNFTGLKKEEVVMRLIIDACTKDIPVIK